MIGELLPLAIDFTTCTVECERALQADALADCIRRKGIAAASADDFASCFQRGRLDETHRTVAFGSLYFIGEIEALFEASYEKITE
jgi:dihydrofolate synthase/folylpolyglutamate synthase